MKLSEVYALLDGAAPKALSDEYVQRYGAYDNSGLLVNTGREVTAIVFTLDLTNEAVDEAIRIGAQLIVTHHPVIYGKIDRLSVESPLTSKIVRCLCNGISIVSMHLNLDMAIGGIDESLQEGLLLAVERAGGKAERIEGLMHPLSQGGYGRVCYANGISAAALKRGLEEEFSATVTMVGNGEQLKRIVSFCGAGVDEGSIAYAVQTGADAMLSADWKHHLIVAAREAGMTVIQLSHYASEIYGFKKYYERIRQAIGLPCVLVTQDEMA